MRFDLELCEHKNKNMITVYLSKLFTLVLLLRANAGNIANTWKKKSRVLTAAQRNLWSSDSPMSENKYYV